MPSAKYRPSQVLSGWANATAGSRSTCSGSDAQARHQHHHRQRRDQGSVPLSRPRPAQEGDVHERPPKRRPTVGSAASLPMVACGTNRMAQARVCGMSVCSIIAIASGRGAFCGVPVRRQPAQAGDDLGEDLDDGVDLGVGGVAAEAEADRAVDGGEGDVHGAQDVRGLERARGAGRARGGADAVLGELVEDALALDEVAGDVEGVGEPLRLAAVDLEIGDAGDQLALQAVALGADAGLVGVVALGGQLEGAREADDEGHVLGPAAPAVLLVAAEQEGPARRAAADEERADALGRVQLVAGEGEQVDVPEVALQVDGELAHRLGGVGVDDDRGVGLLGDPRQLRDREDDPGLVVGVHHRDQQGVGPQGAHEGALVDPALGVDGDEVDLEAAALEVLADLVDRRVLDGGGDDVAALGPGGDGAVDGGVVALGGAGGEQDLGGAGVAEQLRHRAAGGGDGVGRAARGLVHRARVEVRLGQEGHHRVDHLGRHPGRRVVVEVDDGHDASRESSDFSSALSSFQMILDVGYWTRAATLMTSGRTGTHRFAYPSSKIKHPTSCPNERSGKPTPRPLGCARPRGP
jgi:hypothetical protein